MENVLLLAGAKKWRIFSVCFSFSSFLFFVSVFHQWCELAESRKCFEEPNIIYSNPYFFMQHCTWKVLAVWLGTWISSTSIRLEHSAPCFSVRTSYCTHIHLCLCIRHIHNATMHALHYIYVYVHVQMYTYIAQHHTCTWIYAHILSQTHWISYSTLCILFSHIWIWVILPYVHAGWVFIFSVIVVTAVRFPVLNRIAFTYPNEKPNVSKAELQFLIRLREASTSTF